MWSHLCPLFIHLPFLLLSEDLGKLLKKKNLKNFRLEFAYVYDFQHQLSFYAALNSLFLERSHSHFPPLSATWYLTLTQVPYPIFLGRWPCLLFPSEKKLLSLSASFLLTSHFTGWSVFFLSNTNPSQWLLASPKICHQLFTFSAFYKHLFRTSKMLMSIFSDLLLRSLIYAFYAFLYFPNFLMYYVTRCKNNSV